MNLSLNLLLVFIFLFLFLQSASFGQNEYKIDLSSNVQGSKEYIVDSNMEFEIKIINKLPRKGYTVKLDLIQKEYPAFEIKSDSLNIESKGGGAQKCAPLMNYLGVVLMVESEENLAMPLIQLRNEIVKKREFINRYGSDSVDGCEIYHLEYAERVISQTKESIWLNELREGEELHVEISREMEDDETKIWKYVYKTRSPGKWQVSYGLSFIFQGFNKEKTYYSELIDSGFQVSRESNRKHMDFAPSIFFTYMPYKSFSNSVSIGLTGGLGFDMENPTVFLSGTLSYRQNIKIHIGVVAHKQWVLLGKYKEGQPISDNLEKNQLHEELYRLNPFISISFRFKESPFAPDK